MILNFFLNMFCIIGKVLQPIIIVVGFFNCMDFRFSSWHAPYTSKYAARLLDFSLKGHTFQLRLGPDRLYWYIVMHPADTQGARVIASKVLPDNAHASCTGRTALEHHHAKALYMYILNIFLDPYLVSKGVEAL